jgi:hypothetical protein
MAIKAENAAESQERKDRAARQKVCLCVCSRARGSHCDWVVTGWHRSQGQQGVCVFVCLCVCVCQGPGWHTRAEGGFVFLMYVCIHTHYMYTHTLHVYTHTCAHTRCAARARSLSHHRAPLSFYFSFFPSFFFPCTSELKSFHSPYFLPALSPPSLRRLSALYIHIYAA